MLTIGMLIGIKMYPRLGFIYQSQEINYNEYGKLNEVLNYLQSRYVDTLDQQELIEKTIKGIMRQLDPHSMYLSADIYQEEAYAREGQYVGIGAEFFDCGDSVIILNTIPGSPAAAANLQSGDILFLPDNAESIRIQEFIKKSESNSIDVMISKRNGTVESLQINKEVIYISSVYNQRMIQEQTGLITLSRFNNRSYTEFMESMENLVENDGMENLIIDLRQNPGGYLQQAVQILGQLFDEKGKLLVYTQNKFGQRNEYKSRGNPFFKLDKIAILIDEGSASASEILAGALQDWDRATIIGRRSFGKGLVQKEFKLTDGSALLLTVEKYYTPSGRMIQKSYTDREEYRTELHNRWDNGEMLMAEKMLIVDSIAYYTNSGKVVYGGGGIVPDIFIPGDSLRVEKGSEIAISQMYPFLYDLIKQQPEVYEYSFDQLHEWYQSANVLQKYLEKVKLPDQSVWHQFLNRRLKQHLFYFLKGREGMLKIADKDDPFIAAAIATLNGEASQ